MLWVSSRAVLQQDGWLMPSRTWGCADPRPPHRFIEQVNLAAVTIQRWYRRHSQRQRSAAAALGRLLASQREVSPV